MNALRGRGEVMRRIYFLILVALLGLMACQTAAPDPTAEAPQPQATSDKLTAEPSPAPPITIEMGQTAEGAFYQGSPDAPVKLYDFSNFL
jgi:hypothetical protein